MIVLGCDPGSKNFGLFVGKVNKDISKIKVLRSGMITTCLTEMKGNIIPDVEGFAEDYESLLIEYKPDIITLERFQTRGFKGKTIELIGTMLGIMMMKNAELARTKDVDVRLLTAATWKNRVNKISKLKAIYKVMKKRKVVDHRVDAALMSIYNLTDDPYIFLKNNQQRNSFFRQMVKHT